MFFGARLTYFVFYICHLVDEKRGIELSGKNRVILYFKESFMKETVQIRGCCAMHYGV